MLVCPQATENEPGDMDLSGLPETAVDSEEDDDEEDIERASDPLMSRDIVRDCLEKDPMDRTDDDIGECLVGESIIIRAAFAAKCHKGSHCECRKM